MAIGGWVWVGSCADKKKMKCPNPTRPDVPFSCFKQMIQRSLELLSTLPLSFAVANVLAITTGSIVSADVL